MSGERKPTARKPATKFAHLRKKMSKRKVAAGKTKNKACVTGGKALSAKGSGHLPAL